MLVRASIFWIIWLFIDVVFAFLRARFVVRGCDIAANRRPVRGRACWQTVLSCTVALACGARTPLEHEENAHLVKPGEPRAPQGGGAGASAAGGRDPGAAGSASVCT